MKLKKSLSFILTLCLIITLTACSENNSTTEPSRTQASSTESTSIKTSDSGKEGTSKIDNSSAKIIVNIQENLGENIAEILMIDYEGEENPAIEAFNKAIDSSIGDLYQDFTNKDTGYDWIEVKSYPFTSDHYLQIVTTTCIFPTYGTDGDLYSYNFNLKDNRFISTEEALEELNLDKDTMFKNVKGLIRDYISDGSIVGDMDLKGFLVIDGMDGPLTQLLLEVEVSGEDSDPWKTFFAYIPDLDEIIQLNSECLFDPSDMDQMDPPLAYEKENYEVTNTLELAIDTADLEELVAGEEYLFDGMVFYSITKLAPVDYSQEAILDQIESLGYGEIRLTTFTESDEHSGLLSYPSWLIVYDIGENEDTRHCTDVYVQTDTRDYILHASVSSDFRGDYHDEIGKRLASVYWVEE